MRKAAFAMMFLTSPLQAETHQVRMLTRGGGGAMIYEPALLKIAPGDTVQFISAQPGHNAATIEGMIPKGAEPFRSPIGTDFSVTPTTPGTYGIKCSAHFAMGMAC
jgi:pseudoazurin